VLATHEHLDHLDLPAWPILAGASPAARFVVPEPLVPIVVRAGIPADRVEGVRVGQPVRLGSAIVTAVPARHGVDVADGYTLGDTTTPRWVGYVVELGGVRLYHAGDTRAHPRIIEAVAPLRPDVAFLPINGRDAERERRNIVGNLTPDEAAQVARDLSVTQAIPIHFDVVRGNTGRPEAFVAAMRRRHPAASVWVPGLGGGIVWPGGGAAWDRTTA
jgi:L-ascorbate 6-phosphate lactonase